MYYIYVSVSLQQQHAHYKINTSNKTGLVLTPSLNDDTVKSDTVQILICTFLTLIENKYE